MAQSNTTQHLLNEIKDLAEIYPVLIEDRMFRRIARLSRMQKFYESKLPEAPEKQAAMFEVFVSALIYAKEIIQTHRLLTIRLAELAGGGDQNENTTKSL